MTPGRVTFDTLLFPPRESCAPQDHTLSRTWALPLIRSLGGFGLLLVLLLMCLLAYDGS